MSTKKQGFTLVELLVVLAVIGILAGMIFPALKNGMSKAHDEKCRTNLKQLHTACISYANDNNGYMPYAQSFERVGAIPQYDQISGWIAWSPNDGDPDTLSSYKGMSKPQSSKLWHDRGYGEYARFGVKNGVIFEYMNESMEHYVCPAAKKISEEENNVKETIYRTYAMNEFFYTETYPKWWDGSRRLTCIGTTESYKYDDASNEKSYTPEASKLLLFSEIIIPTHEADKGVFNPAKRTRDNACRHGDCVLVAWEKGNIDKDHTDVIMPIHQRRKQKDLDTNEEIDFGFSYAIFVDGHIEQVQQSFKIGTKNYNTLWFLTRGIDPKNTDSIGAGIGKN